MKLPSLTIPKSPGQSAAHPPLVNPTPYTPGGEESSLAPPTLYTSSSNSSSSMLSPALMAAVNGPAASSEESNYSTASMASTMETASTDNASSQSSSTAHLGDVDQLDEEGWREVARAGDIIALGSLGEGIGGSVTRCRLRHGSTVFALKEITTNPNPELQKQILRELQFNRTCNSPHIVKYYGTFMREESANIYIAMEYCGGGSLDAIYKRVKARGGRIGEKVLAKIAEGVLRGLSYLHERRIIHRDIKPQNILLDSSGQVKLCDFGVSGEVVNSLATTFTGTSYYMAPERIQGQPYTVTSDVWSLGLTIMEVAQHRFPFAADDQQPLMPIELLTYIVNMPPPELQDEPSEGIRWSQAFRHFLGCCLEKDNKKRPSPRQMLGHPWIVGQLNKVVKMDKFVSECWS
ncbi:MAP kinase kinase Mkk2p/SSP33 [Trichomonascus vanleenenianus]|uniref:mitogen-activated protein kinase kinase MKK1 n=1 Tax=Trichomonascus vanleenenianus TaxID=2268995 RepID=UPI003ECAAF7C